MGFWKRHSASLVLAGVAATVPQICAAAAGAQALAGFLETRILQQVIFAFWGISAAAMFYFGARMLFEASKDEAFTNVANSFLNAFTGFCVLGAAGAIAAALNSGGLSTDLIPDVSPLFLSAGLRSVSDFIIKMSEGIFVLMVVIAGVRMASSQGEQGEFDKWRKVLLANTLGVVMMLVASAVVATIDTRDTMLVLAELQGMALFILTIIGFLCVAAIIVAGILLIVSIDEGLRDRSKKIIIGTLISLAIVIACYALIRIFVIVPVGPTLL